MDMQFVNYFMKLIQKALEWLQEMWKEAGFTGFPPFSFMPEKEAIDWTTAHREPPEEWDDKRIRLEYQRMLTRNRVRRWRKRQKEGDASTVHTTVTACEKNGVTAGACVTENNATVTEGNGVTAYGNGNSVTGNAKNVTCNASVTECNAAVTGGNDSVTDHTEPATPGCAAVTEVNAAAAACYAAVTNGNDSVTPCNASAKKEKENEKRKNQRKEIKKNKKTKDDTSIGPAKETGERNAAETTATPEAKPDNGNNPPAAEQPPTKSNKIIPTAKLPEAYRNVIEAWNQLPLKTKLKGLYPLVIKQLGYLFEHYGEETVHKAIDRVRESQFLLGQSKNSTGWVVSLTWLLEPEHLEKVLAGQYAEWSTGDSTRLFEPGDEATPFGDGFYGTVVY